jgi:hypothetical protein
VVRAFEAYIAAPRAGEVYSRGGGRESNPSILECLDMIEAVCNRKVLWRHDERNREGDHICYIGDMSKFCAHHPGWSLTRRIADIIEEMVRAQAVAELPLIILGRGDESAAPENSVLQRPELSAQGCASCRLRRCNASATVATTRRRARRIGAAPRYHDFHRWSVILNKRRR